MLLWLALIALVTESIAVRTRPMLVEHSPGVFRDVSVLFNHCLICDQTPRVELVSVRARSGGVEVAPELASSMIADATLGTDDRAIRVESSAAEPPGSRCMSWSTVCILEGDRRKLS